MPDLVDVDLDALAPRPKRVKLGGTIYKLPGDMPLDLFFRLQAFDQRIEDGEDEMKLLGDLAEEVLALFQVHQPKLKGLPPIGMSLLVQTLGAIYSGPESSGEATAAAPATPRQRKRTPSKPARAKAARRAATSR